MLIRLQAVVYIRRIDGEAISLIPKAPRQAIKLTQPPIQCVRSSLGVKSLGHEADHSPH